MITPVVDGDLARAVEEIRQRYPHLADRERDLRPSAVDADNERASSGVIGDENLVALALGRLEMQSWEIAVHLSRDLGDVMPRDVGQWYLHPERMPYGRRRQLAALILVVNPARQPLAEALLLSAKAGEDRLAAEFLRILAEGGLTSLEIENAARGLSQALAGTAGRHLAWLGSRSPEETLAITRNLANAAVTQAKRREARAPETGAGRIHQ